MCCAVLQQIYYIHNALPPGPKVGLQVRAATHPTVVFIHTLLFLPFCYAPKRPSPFFLWTVLLRPPNFHRQRGGWLPPNQHRHRGVLQCSRRYFWALFPENCPSLLQSSDSHLNVASSRVNAWWVSPVGDTARPPPRARFPTQKRQDCRHSRDSLGTVVY